MGKVGLCYFKVAIGQTVAEMQQVHRAYVRCSHPVALTIGYDEITHAQGGQILWFIDRPVRIRLCHAPFIVGSAHHDELSGSVIPNDAGIPTMTATDPPIAKIVRVRE